ncbi:uncharacterized protein LOC106652733 [Trichogramma pretiosum]|uniref:uncharacterized protein LOC106652733 n=1 Tax=Trichogramma pretiosum TaxID=7493 RepID=UPI000C719678|nr:uncharacterized protein LOC106652733 [Trichogramma pretiosum]
MEFIDKPNSWIPAYGFLIQQHQPKESSNDSMGLQQIDFLETIIEENSDDLLTDTSWVDSETDEHIAVDKLNHASGPSSSSSSKSSLLQFEKLERTCYSYDSLQFNNRIRHRRDTSHRKRLDRPISYLRDSLSPDSLEQDDIGGLKKFRAYHSYESLNDPNLFSSWSNQDRQSFFGEASNYAKNCDLSRDPWHLNEIDDYSTDASRSSLSDSSTSPPYSVASFSDENENENEEEHSVLVFGEPTAATHKNAPVSRSSHDLRDFGLTDTKDEEARRRESTFRRLKSSKTSASDATCFGDVDPAENAGVVAALAREENGEGEKDFDIDPSVQLRTTSTRHHHHHHHPTSTL